jgi:ferrous iron transport protein B
MGDHKEQQTDGVIALAGNPNVGQEHRVNALRGMNQHTGNWPGNRYQRAGAAQPQGGDYVIVICPVHIPLLSHSTEEEIARDFICFGGADATVVVCDATCLERNLNLVLQTIEITSQVVVCVNLLDEAKKKGIHIDLEALSAFLGVPVVGTAARSGRGLGTLMDVVASLEENPPSPRPVHYLPAIEQAIGQLEPVLTGPLTGSGLNPRWVALKLLDYDETLCGTLERHLGRPLLSEEPVALALQKAHAAAWQAARAVPPRSSLA